MTAVYFRSTGSVFSRAAARSWTFPGSTSETHIGTPSGYITPWMFPPKSCFFPEYHESISRPFRLTDFSRQRSEATTLPSRITYGVPSLTAPGHDGGPMIRHESLQLISG